MCGGENSRDSVGLSRIFDILYSKFCDATIGLSRPVQNLPFMVQISPHCQSKSISSQSEQKSRPHQARAYRSADITIQIEGLP
jgi:hypothetical protein